jgi:hypothetical protein
LSAYVSNLSVSLLLAEIEIRGKREMLAVRIVGRAAELPAAGAVPIRRIELVDARPGL